VRIAPVPMDGDRPAPALPDATVPPPPTFCGFAGGDELAGAGVVTTCGGACGGAGTGAGARVSTRCGVARSATRGAAGLGAACGDGRAGVGTARGDSAVVLALPPPAALMAVSPKVAVGAAEPVAAASARSRANAESIWADESSLPLEQPATIAATSSTEIPARRRSGERVMTGRNARRERHSAERQPCLFIYRGNDCRVPVSGSSADLPQPRGIAT
jgi:hypothetical protein